MPEDDTRVLVIRRLVEDACESQVHGRRHCVPLCRAVQLDAEDASSVLGNNLIHCRSPGHFGEFHCKSRLGAAPAAPDNVATLSRMFLWLRNGTARTQTIDFSRAKSELPENLLVVFSDLWGALRGHLGDAMHLKRAADRGRQLAAGAVERNDDVVRPELGIADHLLWPTHRSERHVNAVEHLVPMRHRLG